MGRPNMDFLNLIAAGSYYLLQKRDDRNREDISIQRDDGVCAGIHNYPYRLNQMPAYIFDELVREGMLEQSGSDERGLIFRATEKARQMVLQAA
jgi:hypothetical protein